MANQIPPSATSDAEAQQPAPYLPPEILNKIILHFISSQRGPLRRRDLIGLLAVSLISKAWLIAARRQLWIGYCFRLPELNHRLSTLRQLYTSPHYSLGLETIKELTVSPEYPFSSESDQELRWCGEVLKGVKTITIEGPATLIGQTTPIPNCFIEDISLFRRVTTLNLERVNFASPIEFYHFLVALGNRLENLKCSRVRTQSLNKDGRSAHLPVTEVSGDATKTDLPFAGKRMPIKTRVLEIDFEAFLRLIHAGGLEVVGLEQLTFVDHNDVNPTLVWRLPKPASKEYPLIPRLNTIGQMLTLCGKDLRRLKFRFLRDDTYKSSQDVQKREAPKFFDLSMLAPMLREIDIQTKNPDCILSMFHFSLPHTCLSFIEISQLPSLQNRLEFDRALERSVPRLEELVFAVPEVIPKQEHLRGSICLRLQVLHIERALQALRIVSRDIGEGDSKESWKAIRVLMQDNAVARLPQEMFYPILENLHDDIPSLRQCALAARCLLPVSRSLLFRVTGLFVQEKIDQFHRLLEISPHLAQYVVQLHAALYSSPDHIQASLSSIVRRSTALETVRLLVVHESFTASEVYALLGEEAPRIKTFSLRFIMGPGLNVKDAYSICEYLAKRGGLQDLRLAPLRTKGADVVLPSNTHSLTPLNLRILTIAGESNALGLFFGWAISSGSCLQFNDLRVLRIRWLTEPDSSVTNAATNTPRHPKIAGDPTIRSLPFLILDSCPNLCTITCSIFAQGDEGPTLNTWCTAIKRLSRRLRLEEFNVTVELSSRPTEYPWTVLDDALVAVPCFRKLRIKFNDVQEGPQHNRVSTDNLRTWFPQVHGSNKIELVAAQSVWANINCHPLEYSSRSGEWKTGV
ncbi:hypothetical protein VNI00_004259 [Paramarasmius palmivorus]|uniref:F-box domain-containing protein n=1 Tax=Paramarasmius palmivorus TaxID=297713 RepID=A0AAW0DPU6_9AGAR